MMKELMEYYKDRPQTWEQRKRELEDNHQIGWEDTGPLPRFITLLPICTVPAFLEAQKITHETDFALSEELYPDCPDCVIVYLIGEMKDRSEFWHLVRHLGGYSYHECDVRCTTYNLPAFVVER